MPTREAARPFGVRKHCRLDEAGTPRLKAVMAQLGLAARAFHRVLQLSRTIADLAGSDSIQLAHLPETPDVLASPLSAQATQEEFGGLTERGREVAA